MARSNRVFVALRVIFRVACVIAVFGVDVLLGTVATAQMGDDGRCVYDRRDYPDGEQMCQGSQLVQCSDGAWEDIGDCDAPTPEPAPISSGGDVEMN